MSNAGIYEVRQAGNEVELNAILELRYKILREPWQQPFESASDGMEGKCVNAFVADSTGKVIACGRLQENAGKTGQIRYMAVDEAYRGKGLGKQVLVYLEKKAREMRFTKIELQARENAQSFYRDQQYILREKSFLLWGKIQHYLMEKII